MKIFRFLNIETYETAYALKNTAGEYVRISDPFDEEFDKNNIQFGGEILDVSRYVIDTPSTPSKAVCIGLNYAPHAAETNYEKPKSPVVFIKPNSALLYHHGYIVRPSVSKRVDYEAELAVVINKTCHAVSPEEAMDYVLGFSCANDVTARDLQPHDGQWTISKGFDTFLPYGPCIETELDIKKTTVMLKLNGEVKQKGNTEDMIFSIPYLVSYVSSVMTLFPEDIILTGTPSGIGPIKEGDIVEVEIEGIGTLTNYVMDEEIGRE